MGCVVVVAVRWNIADVIRCLLVVKLALFVDFQWASGGRSNFVGEWASLRNRTVLLWVCSGPDHLPVYRSGHTPASE